MKTPSPLRLADCGDLLDARLYSAWMLQNVNTTYQQVHDGSVLVKPWTVKPLRWRRVDCEERLGQRDLAIQQRKERVKRRMSLPRAS